MGYYPIMIDLKNKPCLIVGGGEIALRKAKSLIECGANVRVVSPGVVPELEQLNVEIVKRKYAPGDCAGFVMVFAATNDHDVNAAVFEEAVSAGILVNVVDDPEHCSFIVPAVVRRGELILSVSTSGLSPALSKRIKNQLESMFGKEYGEYLDILGQLRNEIKAKISSQKEREELFNRLLDSGILELVCKGNQQEALERARKCIY